MTFLYCEEYDNPALYLEKLSEYKDASELATQSATQDTAPLAVGRYFVFAVKRGETFEAVQRTETPLLHQQMCIQGGRRFIRRTIKKKDDETVFQVDISIAHTTPLYELRYSTGGQTFHKTKFSFVDTTPCTAPCSAPYI